MTDTRQRVLACAAALATYAACATPTPAEQATPRSHETPASYKVHTSQETPESFGPAPTQRAPRAARSRPPSARVRPAGTTRPAPAQPAGDVWAALARCESGGDPNARSSTGKYTGAFQFSNATWQSLGYSGSAGDHSYATQLEGAQRLQARSGFGQWPRCAAKLGLA